MHLHLKKQFKRGTNLKNMLQLKTSSYVSQLRFHGLTERPTLLKFDMEIF